MQASLIRGDQWAFHVVCSMHESIDLVLGALEGLFEVTGSPLPTTGKTVACIVTLHKGMPENISDYTFLKIIFPLVGGLNGAN